MPSAGTSALPPLLLSAHLRMVALLTAIQQGLVTPADVLGPVAETVECHAFLCGQWLAAGGSASDVAAMLDTWAELGAEDVIEAAEPLGADLAEYARMPGVPLALGYRAG